jgi:hypothetical protein
MKALYPARVLGLISAVLLALGATGPLAKATLLTAYLADVSKVRVGLLLATAAAAAVSSIMGRTKELRWAALTAVLILASLAAGGNDAYIPVVSEATQFIMDILKAVFTDVAKAIVHLQWGGYCLFAGLVMMATAGFMKQREG